MTNISAIFAILTIAGPQQVQAPAILATPAPATQEDLPVSPDASSSPNWSVGGGIVVPFTFQNGLGLSQLGFSSGVERRLTDRAWLMLDVNASFSSGVSDSTVDGEGAGKTNSQSLGAGGAAGVRYQLVDDAQLVRPSVFVSLATQYAEATTTSSVDVVSDTSSLSSLSVAINTGGALDVALTDSIVLRMQSTIASAAWQFTDTTQRQSNGDDSVVVQTVGGGGIFGLSVVPQIQLRIFFG